MTTRTMPLGASAGEGADADGDMLRQMLREMLRCRPEQPRPACRTGPILAAAERLGATPD